MTTPSSSSPARPPRPGVPGSVVAVAVETPVLATAAPEVDERTRTDTTTDDRRDRPWDVIVWDDPVNLMSYVVWVFMRVFSFSEPVARKLMLEVHERGRSLVASEPREKAELYLQQLHGHGLKATIQRQR